MLDKKYDVETALVIETSVTDAVMQVAEMETELVRVSPRCNAFYIFLIFSNLLINLVILG